MASQKQLQFPSTPSEPAIARSKKMALKIEWLGKKKLGWSYNSASVELGLLTLLQTTYGILTVTTMCFRAEHVHSQKNLRSFRFITT